MQSQVNVPQSFTIVIMYMFPAIPHTSLSLVKPWPTKDQICTQIPQIQQTNFLRFTTWSQGNIRIKLNTLYLKNNTIQRSTLRSAKAVYFIIPLGTIKSRVTNKRLQR